MKCFFWAPLFLLFSCSNNKGQLTIQNKGSDTLVNLAQAWAEEYKKAAPHVAIAVSGGGSGTGIAALLNGTVDIANSSRPLNEEEKNQAIKNNVTDIKEYIVGLDALAVIVHPSNPIKRMTKKQLACIFGKEGNCQHWNEVNEIQVPGCQKNQIIRISRQSNSGTFQYFRESILGKKKDFRLGSMDLNGSKEGIDMVANTPCAIGYTGMGYLNQTVKAVCLADSEDGPCIYPSIESITNKTYPIARELFMFTAGKVRPEIKNYFEWLKTEAALNITRRSGYVPVILNNKAAHE